MKAPEIHARHRSFGGELLFCSHQSDACGGTMRFSVFLPPGEKAFPVLVWLSGLTCTEENFMAKAGAQKNSGDVFPATARPIQEILAGAVAADHALDGNFGVSRILAADRAVRVIEV